MKHRSLLKVFALHIITFGIYFVYWLVMTRRDMIRLGATKIPSLWMIFWPALALLASMILLGAVGSTTGNADLFAEPSSTQVITDVLFFLILALAVIASIILPFVWLWRYSAGVEFVTKKQTERDFAFWLGVLLWLFGFPIVWQLIMQDAFNKVGSAKINATPKNYDTGASFTPQTTTSRKHSQPNQTSVAPAAPHHNQPKPPKFK